MYKNILKSVLDFFLSLLIFLAISPILLLVWILLIAGNCGSWSIFVQTRPGKGGKLFKVIKFKTMNDKKDSAGNLLPDNKRITQVGKIVRSLSIDELPQLINVLKGDMSLVGPRPLLVQYLPLYSERQLRRHEVKPGMTGWAQVNGRNAISWEQKFEYDVWYVDNLSLWLDIKILLLTVKRVFFRDGINAASDVTMEPFKGSK
jgi:lipopolysaccharide/colanic/teichoic acid biosynthesis glycosyltransferase